MRLFLKKILIFAVIPCIMLMTIEVALPLTFFSYRHFEAVMFKTRVPHYAVCYPNINSTMNNAVGDLCHHTRYAIRKKEIWKTDKLGFRNDEFVDEADILFIGDSFLFGTGLSQDETLSNQVKSKSNCRIKVYSMGMGSFFEFDKCIKLGIIKKPKWVVFEIVERSAPLPFQPFCLNRISKLKQSLKDVANTAKINVYIDRAFRFYMINWLMARFQNDVGMGKPSIGNSNMFFLNGTDLIYEDDALHKTVKTLVSYKNYCDSNGIKFLFLPIPNKETVYYERVPLRKQPVYLLALDSMLKDAGIPAINSLKVYNDFRKDSDSALLYHLDDTHWNAKGVELIAEEVIKKTEEDKTNGQVR